MKRKNVAVLSVVLLCALLLSGCGTLTKAAKLTEYDFGTDKIPSVNAVTGSERKVTGVSVGTSNGTQYKEYTYETSAVRSDLTAYLNFLMDSDWVPINDFDLNYSSGTAKLASESADVGKILIITVTFNSSGYTIRAEKGEGTLTRI